LTHKADLRYGTDEQAVLEQFIVRVRGFLMAILSTLKVMVSSSMVKIVVVILLMQRDHMQE